MHRVRVRCSVPAVILQGTPDQTLSAQQLPGHMRGVRPAGGFTDIQFLGGGQYGLAAACASGQVSSLLRSYEGRSHTVRIVSSSSHST